MGRNPRHDILFDPVTVGPKMFRNRFWGVPYDSGFGPTAPLAHASHREVQAEGGWSCIFTGVTSVSQDHDPRPFGDRLWSEEEYPALQLFRDRVHAHGALAGVEIGHVGADAVNKVVRLPAVAPSQLASWRRPLVIPKAIERSDIRRILGDLNRAAAAVRELGFDLVSLYGAFSYLPAQFLSPFYNKRADEYGGSFRNRARFWLEALETIRSAVEDDLVVATRISAAGLSRIGISLEDTLEFIRLADELVDVWDVTVGAEWEKDSGTSRFFGEGYQLEWSGRIREATSKPIVGVGRLTSPDRMAEILRSGVWDFIGGARPRIADPFLPRKIEEGRYDDIRECTGSNLCVASMYGVQLACFQNPTAGEEYRHGWHPERVPPARNAENDVLVLGAGPAGLECALTLARRGMRRVHLVDAESEIGGTLRWVSTLPTLGEWSRVINHRGVQLDKQRNVEIVLGQRLGIDDVLAYGADYVVIATGSSWAGDGLNYTTHEPIPGADSSLAHVLTPEQIMLEGKRPPGHRVVVFDTDGYYMAPGLGEVLTTEGFMVEIVTALPKVSPFSDETMEGALLRERLAKAGVTWRTLTMLEAVEPGQIRVRDSMGREEAIEIDGLVLTTHRLSNETLYLDLVADPNRLTANDIQGVFRVGDCVAPRTFAEAVLDGHRLARQIDEADPAVALPALPDGSAELNRHIHV
jgi:dimethylamine/trimethylamine dehydrogenase